MKKREFGRTGLEVSELVLGGGAMSGAEVACVVGIHPVGDGVEAELVDQRLEHAEQLGLAEIAAVRPVRAVVRPVHLVGVHEAMSDAELADDLFRQRPVARGVGG